MKIIKNFRGFISEGGDPFAADAQGRGSKSAGSKSNSGAKTNSAGKPATAPAPAGDYAKIANMPGIVTANDCYFLRGKPAADDQLEFYKDKSARLFKGQTLIGSGTWSISGSSVSVTGTNLKITVDLSTGSVKIDKSSELAAIKQVNDSISQQISQWVVDLYANSSFWQPWKSGWGDDEDSAWRNGFCKQWDIDIAPKLKVLIDNKTKLEGLTAADQPLAADQEALSLLSKIKSNVDTFNAMRESDVDDSLQDTHQGANDTDVFAWTIQTSTGFKSYTVDADF